MSQSPELSVVATVYNDAVIVPVLTEAIITALKPTGIEFEIILVNDYSRDNSEEAIERESKKYPFVKGLSLSRNFGQQIAMSAGMRFATGRCIAVMDGDMQNPPDVLPDLLKKMKEGFDIVYCVSKARNNFIDAFTSRLFNWVLTGVLKVNIVPNQLMMKMMTREFLAEYNRYEELTRTVDAIVTDVGMKYAVLDVQNRKRHSGKSNYNFFKRFNLMVDMIISLSTSPLNFLIHMGWIIFTLTCAGAGYYLYLYLFKSVPEGYTSIVLSVFFFGSLIILMLGIIGRYLANIYLEVKNRPLFHIRKKFNL